MSIFALKLQIPSERQFWLLQRNYLSKVKYSSKTNYSSKMYYSSNTCYWAETNHLSRTSHSSKTNHSSSTNYSSRRVFRLKQMICLRGINPLRRIIRIFLRHIVRLIRLRWIICAYVFHKLFVSDGLFVKEELFV